jgi:EAL domain-containing protein (putative c-di-GMP-specific phosphodiesterase class I)
MKLQSSTCSLRLPFDFLDSKETYSHMRALFKEHSKKLPFKLVIEMPDKLISQNSEAVKLYKELLDEYNIELAVFDFIGESTDYQYLQELRPSYIKGEKDYFLGQSEQGLSALKLITDSMGIDLIATGVMDMDTLHSLQAKYINIVQGRATEMIER